MLPKSLKFKILCILTCLCWSASAQMTVGTENVMPSSQVWSFMKYGGMTPHLYTGTVRADIPIYTYTDPDFEIPIYLSYASNGYMPNVQAGQEGLGWYLNMGGFITRETRGIQDEAKGYSFNKKTYDIKGFYYFSHPRKVGGEVDAKLDQFSIDGDRSIYTYKAYIGKSETQSDIYTFNFMGHRGKFMITADSVVVFGSPRPAGEYNVDLSSINRGIISIKTGNGYTYTFNMASIYENYKNPEFGKSLMWKFISENDTRVKDYEWDQSRYPDTWLLTSVKTPGFRYVTFKYSNMYDRSSVSENVRPAVTTLQHEGASKDLLHMELPEERKALLFYKVDVPYVKEIQIKDRVTIQFDYSPREHAEKVYLHGAAKDLTAVLDKLDSITVFNADSCIVRKCRLSYTYASQEDSNPVMFLDKVSLSGEGDYKLDYFGQNNTGDFIEQFPYHGTVSIDYWGYYNSANNYNLEQFIDEYSEPTRTTAPIHTRRSENYLYARRGMLRKLTYPTKGFTTYEYGPHTYTRYLERGSQSNGLPVLQNNSGWWGTGNAGGLCLKAVTDYADADSPIRRKTYKYKGNLLFYPQFDRHYRMEDKNGKWWQEITIHSGADLSGYVMDGSHIEYGEVMETSNDGSYVKYRYSNYEDAPDLYGPLTDSVSAGFSYNIVSPEFITNLERRPDYISQARGRLLSKAYYTAAGKCVRQEINRYDTSLPQIYTKGVERAGDIFYVQRSYLENYPLKEVQIIDIPQGNSNNALTTSTLYTYNAYKQVKRICSIGSAGEKVEVKTRYITDIPAEERTTELLKSLASNKREAVLRQEKRVDGKLVEATDYTYKFLDRDSVPQSFPINFPASHFRFPVLYKIASGQNPQEGEPLPTVMTFDEYDIDGHVFQTTGIDGIPKCCIWGYHGMYPVATIENITYKQLNNTFHPYYLESLPAGLSEEAEAELRARPHYRRINVFRYKPLVGVVETTDPAARMTTYEYNDDGKLILVRDNDGNPMQSYHYSTKK